MAEVLTSNWVTMDLRAAQIATEGMIRRHSKTFYLATGLLPSTTRRAIRALYAFCRATDDLVDVDGATVEDVDNWRSLLSMPRAEQRQPVVRLWQEVRDAYGVDPRYEHELVDGVSMDVSTRSYADWNELERYCYLVASTVGLMAIPILGLARGATFETAAPYAIKLGIALQLTNILRDVGEDARGGRVYLPQSDLQAFGLTHRDILDGVDDERFARLMQFEIARARDLFDKALPGIAWLVPHVRPAVGAAALLYRAILDEIERIEYKVHHLRAHTTARRKIAMLPWILAYVLRLGHPHRKRPRRLTQTREPSGNGHAAEA